MTLSELIALYRADSFDHVDPPFCSDELLTIYANEAQNEACRRSQLLLDSVSSMCMVPYDIGDEAVKLDARIVQVLSAQVEGRPVSVMSAAEMEACMPEWQSPASAVKPSTLVSGVTAGYLHLWPTPSQAGEIKLRVQRLPMRPMDSASDVPEIRPELHASLVPWMLYRAYSRADADLADNTKAAIQLARFEVEFGRKTSGRNEEWVRRGEGVMPGPIA